MPRAGEVQAPEKWAACATVAAISAAFIGAGITAETGIMSLSPPATDAHPNPAPDVRTPLILHQAAFTAWAALALAIPAFVAFPLRRVSDSAARIWRPFWTAAYIAFLVHMLWSMGAFFGWDFDWMRNTPRVSAFWPGIAVLFWWPMDLILAWRGHGAAWVEIQRAILTAVLFVLFVGGSTVTGELWPVRGLGLILFGAMIAAMLIRIRARRARIERSGP